MTSTKDLSTVRACTKRIIIANVEEEGGLTVSGKEFNLISNQSSDSLEAQSLMS